MRVLLEQVEPALPAGGRVRRVRAGLGRVQDLRRRQGLGGRPPASERHWIVDLIRWGQDVGRETTVDKKKNMKFNIFVILIVIIP